MTNIGDSLGVEILFPALAFLLGVIITQWINSLFAKKIRKHSVIELSRDSDLQNIEILVFEIRKLSIDYWSNSLSFNEQLVLGHSIAARFGFLGMLISRLFVNFPDEQNILRRNLRSFTFWCTGNDFLSQNRKLRPYLTKNIEDLAYKIVDLSIEYRRRLPFEKPK